MSPVGVGPSHGVEFTATMVAGVLVVLALGGGCREAVLNAPPVATINLTASPTVIDEAAGESSITAIVRIEGEPVPDGVIVNFFTDLGEIDSQTTTRDGIATVTLRATGTAGVATVSALSGAAPVATIAVRLGVQVDTVLFSFSPPSLPSSGGSSVVTVQLLDSSNRAVIGRRVRLSVEAPSTLASSGNEQQTDTDGKIVDTVTTTVTATITATIDGGELTQDAILTVAGSSNQSLILSASPSAMPTGGGTTTVRAFLTTTGGAPIAGEPVTFAATSGTLSATTAVTDGSGLAFVTLTTTLTSTVTAATSNASAATQVIVGVVGGFGFTIVLATDRTTITSSIPSGVMGCDPGAGNPQLPVIIRAIVQDGSGSPVSGVPVTLTIAVVTEQGQGGFCPSPSTATQDCGGGCPTPPTAPTPSPTPASGCVSSTLAKSVTGTSGTDGAGVVDFPFTFEETEICDCRFRRKACVATITASSAQATALNTIDIEMP